MILRLSILFCLLMILQYAHGIDYDYYFNPLRSKKILNCTSEVDKDDCQLQCTVGIGLCLSNKCYCLSLKEKVDNIKVLKNIAQVVLQKRRGSVQLSDDFGDYSVLPGQKRQEKQAKEPDAEYLDPLLLGAKPLLRHHIAHFCPNLQVARTCIKTCMKEGKPAFCGKDHVCYCGHRYAYTDNDPSVNVSSVYSEFHDMYEKYFGPNYKQQIQV